MYEIKKLLTDCNFYKGNHKKNEFIVIHYTANNGDTARSDAEVFRKPTTKASSNYIVDETSTIYQSVLDSDTAWHCGTTGTYFHPKCRNSNSIGIEICSRNSEYVPPKKPQSASHPGWYFLPAAENNAADLASDLMLKYNIPIENVIRHYDVTHKICPAPYVNNPNSWTNFKKLVQKFYELKQGGLTVTQYEELKSKIEILQEENYVLKQAIGWDNKKEQVIFDTCDDSLDSISPDAKAVIQKLIDSGRLAVDQNGKFAPLSKASIRLLIIQNR